MIELVEQKKTRELDGVRVIGYISSDLALSKSGVVNTIRLFEDGGTVPFIARYRKEQTGGLDETQIRSIEEKWQYYTELEKRKVAICKSVSDQGKMTDALFESIMTCREKQKLEDIYLPYKPKKRSKATVAIEKGLEPLADLIMQQEITQGDYESIVVEFVDTAKGVMSVEEAMIGARDIIIERINDNADIRAWIRAFLEDKGLIVTRARKGYEEEKTKYEMYYNFSELLKESPSHRLLAIRRGATEEVISWSVEVSDDNAIDFMHKKFITNKLSIFTDDLMTAIRLAYRRIFISLETEVFVKMLQQAEEEAIRVFAKNLHTLLLEAPAGQRNIMGIDPGFRTGCKIAIIDDCGTYLEYRAIFPHEPQCRRDEAASVILDFITTYDIELIAIGNGTASRETMTFVQSILPKGIKTKVVFVSEAGASVYSASPVAIKEFPNLDVTVRGAISIARRLQDPLAELVKIDPKSIGVGQYQHDVNQSNLRKSLDSVVESCVNYVGVELNTASQELLSHVAGIGPTLARNIVKYRSENGFFSSRNDLRNVSKLGEKAFEQCAGFLRVRGSENRLDNSGIHPERYEIVEKMAADLGIDVDRLLGERNYVKRISVDAYVCDDVGLPTLQDIIRELEKPGLDPRAEFTNIEFRSDIQDINDLKENMVLTGKVTNVTNFGAFVDIGVHQDGLIHISKLSDRFVKDPYEIVSVGQTVKVRVLDVDVDLKRISLERVVR